MIPLDLQVGRSKVKVIGHVGIPHFVLLCIVFGGVSVFFLFFLVHGNFIDPRREAVDKKISIGLESIGF